jgi:hypothetical protein
VTLAPDLRAPFPWFGSGRDALGVADSDAEVRGDDTKPRAAFTQPACLVDLVGCQSRTSWSPLACGLPRTTALSSIRIGMADVLGSRDHFKIAEGVVGFVPVSMIDLRCGVYEPVP